MWALDFGTTNTALAYWDEDRQRAVLLEMPEISRSPEASGSDEALEAPHLIPSAVEPFDRLSLWSMMGRWPPVQRVAFWGKQAFVGRAALDRSGTTRKATLVDGFKSFLSTSPLRTLTKIRGQSYSAREITRLFLRELLGEAAATSGRAIRELTVTTPVDSYEGYRAEIASILRDLGVRRLRYIDEPVAAALGYDIAPGKDRNALVVDFGGGTLDVALVTLDARNLSTGRCRVLGKSGRPIGGQLVDRWLAEDSIERLGYRLEASWLDDPRHEWARTIRAEACRVKERLFFDEQVTLVALPPDDLHRFDERMRGGRGALTYSRDELIALLERRGLYRALQESVDECLEQSKRDAGTDVEVDDVLMVGGSTLLPNVYKTFEERFGRESVRAWHPFEAVVQGACRFSSGRIQTSDFIVHDYAFLTHDLETHQRKYAIIIPSGTRFPTTADYWKRQLFLRAR
ncbi:MAG: Hsp70 family protein [Myxococcales bacterium]|nr:Hsp70 family protein [Myxococcales bacterium]